MNCSRRTPHTHSLFHCNTWRSTTKTSQQHVLHIQWHKDLYTQPTVSKNGICVQVHQAHMCLCLLLFIMSTKNKNCMPSQVSLQHQPERLVCAFKITSQKSPSIVILIMIHQWLNDIPHRVHLKHSNNEMPTTITRSTQHYTTLRHKQIHHH